MNLSGWYRLIRDDHDYIRGNFEVGKVYQVFDDEHTPIDVRVAVPKNTKAFFGYFWVPKKVLAEYFELEHEGFNRKLDGLLDE